MAAVDLSKVVKQKKFWVASFLLVWAGALQGKVWAHEAFKAEFGDPDKQPLPPTSKGEWV